MEPEKATFFKMLAKVAQGKHTREYRSLKDLEKNHQYSATNFRFKTTRNGMSVAVDLDDDIFIFLPDRYKDVITTETHLEWLNTNKTTIKYFGQNPTKNNAHDLVIEGIPGVGNAKKTKKPKIPSYNPNFVVTDFPKIDEVGFDGEHGFYNTQLPEIQ